MKEHHHIWDVDVCLRWPAEEPSAPEDATGGAVWPISHSIAAFCTGTGMKLRGRRVLELGAGTGVLSIAAALQGARVTATDLPDRLPAILANSAANAAAIDRAGGTICTAAHRWGAGLEGLAPPYDLVLGGDLVYWGGGSLFAEDSRAALLRTLAGLADLPAAPGEVTGGGPLTGRPQVLGFPVRDPARERAFLAAAAAGFDARFAVRRCGAAPASQAAGEAAGGGGAGEDAASWWGGGPGLAELRGGVPDDLAVGDEIMVVLSAPPRIDAEAVASCLSL